ncbi:MAG: hypothetical protein K0R50_3919 [Eubacterium sp.]|jgi:hypothetical protein|nr:hypothetical protein [Eubacterium sp.]
MNSVNVAATRAADIVVGLKPHILQINKLVDEGKSIKNGIKISVNKN